MALNTEYSIILGYVVFLLLVGVMANLGAPTFLENVPPTPNWPDAPTVWDYLSFPIANIAYFFYIMGVTALTYPFLNVILLGYGAVFLYIMLGLLRGGH